MPNLSPADRATIGMVVELFTAARTGEPPHITLGRIIAATDPDALGVTLASTLAGMTLLAKALAECLPHSEIDAAVQVIAHRIIEIPQEGAS